MYLAGSQPQREAKAREAPLGATEGLREFGQGCGGGRRCLISHVPRDKTGNGMESNEGLLMMFWGRGAVGGDEDCWKVMESLQYGPNTIPSIQWCLTVLTPIFQCHLYGHYELSPPSALQGPARACMA